MPALLRLPRFAAVRFAPVRGGLATALLLASFVTSTPASAQTVPAPPVAPQRPHVHTEHGVERSDPYVWLREIADPAVTAYLNAENAYTAARTAANAATEAAIYGEILGRIQQDDASAPVRDNGYVYQTRYAEGQQYPVYVRRRDAPGAPDEVLLDGNARAAGHAYWGLGALDVSDDNRLMAFAEDTVSRRIYTVRFRDLTTGEMLPDVLETTTGQVVWAADHRTVFYGGKNPETLRSERVMRHRLGTPQSADVEVFFEADEEFNVGIERSKDRALVFVVSDQTDATEVRFVDATTPEAAFTVVEPRTAGLEYTVEHVQGEHVRGEAGGRFVVRANADGAANFALFTAPVASPGRASWRVLVPAREEAFIEQFDVFAGHLVTQEREDGLVRLRIRGHDGTVQREVPFDEPTYAVSLAANPEYDTATLRYVYASMTTPGTTYDERGWQRPERRRPERRTVPRARQARPGPRRLRRRALRHRARLRHCRRRHAHSRLPRPRPHDTRRRDGAAAALRLRLVRPLDERGLLDPSPEPARPRLRLRHRARPRRAGDGPRVVRERAVDAQDEHVHRLHRRGRAPRRRELRRPARLYAQGGSRAACSMGAVVNLRPDLFKGVHRRRPVRGRRDDDARRVDSAHDVRVRRVGQPERGGRLPHHARLQPRRQRGRQAYPPILVTTGLHDSQVQVLGARQVGRARSARSTSGANPRALQDQHGRGPRRRLRPLRALPRGRLRIRLVRRARPRAAVTYQAAWQHVAAAMRRCTLECEHFSTYTMRRLIVLAVFAAAPLVAPLVVPRAALAQEPGRVVTAADYARAERFLAPATFPLVSGTASGFAWQTDGRLTYRTATPSGSGFFAAAPPLRTRARRLRARPPSTPPPLPERSRRPSDGPSPPSACPSLRSTLPTRAARSR